jgi:hypothetical protein
LSAGQALFLLRIVIQAVFKIGKNKLPNPKLLVQVVSFNDPALPSA